MTDSLYTEASLTSRGARLQGYLWRAVERIGEAPLVVMCHGLTNNHNDAPLFAETRDALLEKGFSVFMFDFFGSGNSQGEFCDKTLSLLRQNLGDVLSFVEREGLAKGKDLGLFGRSVGGTISSFFAKDPRVGAVVLASPPFVLTQSFSKLYSPPREGYVSLPETIQRSGQIKGEWKLNAGFFNELESLQEALVQAVDGAMRVLVTQGVRDNKAALESTRKLFELLREPKEFRLLPDADHEYHGFERDVVTHATEWLKAFLDGSKNDS